MNENSMVTVCAVGMGLLFLYFVMKHLPTVNLVPGVPQ